MEPTRTSSVYGRLKHDLISGEIRPDQQLRMDALRERYQIGASPIREALNRLASEGFVEQLDRRGFRSRPISLEELEELTRTRCWIGELALRESMKHGNDAWEESILISFHRMEKSYRLEGASEDRSPSHALHKRFHETLLCACRSQLLIDFWNVLFDAAKRYQQLSLLADGVERNIGRAHRELMEAVIARDVELAVKLHTAHIEQTRDLVRKAMALTPAKD